MRRTPVVLLSALLACAVLVLGSAPACADELIVSAAASLANAFKEIGAGFEKANAGHKVAFNFAASGALLQQIERGAPVDVFASADQETMDQAAAKNLIAPASRKVFAVNRLVLIVPAASAAAPRAATDLKGAEFKRVAVGNPASVPVGRYTRDVLTAEGSWEALAPKFINADSVRQVLDYVARGEVDAGFVYATDAAIAKDKVRVAATLATKKPVEYPIALVAAGKRPPLAGAFLAYVAGAEGRAVLAKYGFGLPEAK